MIYIYHTLTPKHNQCVLIYFFKLILIFQVVMKDDDMKTTLSNQCCSFPTIEKDNVAAFDINKMSHNLSDPANWPQLLTKAVQYEIVKIGPLRIDNYDFPVTTYENGQKRRFTTNYYYRQLSNGDVIDRKWLVYSKIKDSVYCFPYFIFQNH